jgi:hypothetical protein
MTVHEHKVSKQNMKHLYVPSVGVEDWSRLLAKPKLHWKTGYSARTLAHCWEASSGFPPEILDLATRSKYPKLHEIECLLALPEYKVSLPGGSNASQNDQGEFITDHKSLL